MTWDIRWMTWARRQAAVTQRWWIANRMAAPTMFRDELARVLELLQQNPYLGIGIRERDVRRLLLPDSQQFIYYRLRPRTASGGAHTTGLYSPPFNPGALGVR